MSARRLAAITALVASLAAAGSATAQWTRADRSGEVRLASVGVAAGQAVPANPLADAFRHWIVGHKPATAIMAVRQSGRTVFVGSHGTEARQPTLIGSLSKAITGACIATLVRDGRLAFDTPMREALAGFFARHGRPRDTRFETVTVEQLLVHRSGMLGNDDGDPLYAIRQARAERGLGHGAAPQVQLAEHLNHRLARDPGGDFAYSNSGYIALSALIEERSGRSYEDYCREAVLAPLGIASARLHPDWRMFAGSGGWIVEGTDYLALLDIFDPAHPFLGERVKAWIAASRTKWEPANRGAWYSLGVHTELAANGWRVTHEGGLNAHGRDASGRPASAVIASFGTRDADGSSLFVAMTPAQDDGAALQALAQAFGRARSATSKIN